MRCTNSCSPRLYVDSPRRHLTFDRCLAVASSVVLAVSLTGCGSGDSASSSPSNAANVTLSLPEACAAFKSQTLPHNAQITKTEIRPSLEGQPEVCIVRGKIVSSPTSTINWAVELPGQKAWNGKTVTIGGGGFDGFIPTDNPIYHQWLGPTGYPYVKISSDSGHDAGVFTFYPWATDDVALRNHAFEANHLALEVGTEIASNFYGRKPTRRYMFGQSNGGRSGIIAVQKYPHDYDGVIALAPAISQQGHEANVGPDLMRHIFSNRDNWMSPAKVALFAAAEVRACDELDGLKDGIIGNIESCNYIPTDLLCTQGDNDSCLTAGQIETVRRIYSDRKISVQLADGYIGYPRYGRGGATSDWNTFMFGPSFEDRAAGNYVLDEETAKVVTNSASTSLLTYDPTLYQPQWTRLSSMIDALNPDLSAYANSGGKLLIWYGLGDSVVSVYRTAEYWNNIRQKMGDPAVKGFARFLTSPSIGHDLEGPGAGRFDYLAAMDAWVEQNQTPDNLVAGHYEGANSNPKFTRPLCEYPKFARYTGSGDPTKAESFTCSLN